MRKFHALIASISVALLCAAYLAGCSERGTPPPGTPTGGDFVLRSADGPVDTKALRGKVLLIYFGYTHCPDVCPVHVANIAAAMKALTFEERARTTLVFVTTDPARDSLPVLRSWLATFDSTFVGLTGPVDEVSRIAAQLQVAPAMFGARNPDGSYEVGHGAQVIVWQPDDTARVIYPFGVRQAEWAEAMPRLVGRAPSLMQRLTGKS